MVSFGIGLWPDITAFIFNLTVKKEKKIVWEGMMIANNKVEYNSMKSLVMALQVTLDWTVIPSEVVYL